MAPKLITMLTYNDETVQDAFEVFDQCADLPDEFWGFKDVGLPQDRMKELVRRMRDKGKTTFLEIVTLTEPECLAGAELALECGFDYLMGTVFYPSVFELMKGKATKFFPFCGKVSGHPSILEGDIREIIDDARDMAAKGVEGFDLLAYRYTGDAERLAAEFVRGVGVPVVLAGSIDGFPRLDAVKKIDPWAFTIGSAFFDKKFVPGGSFREQMASVLAYLEK
ncbi:MAG: hypothetical protein JW820_14300 [Spirochaetales bacterium]|nr:hypothetical protein [Spirochaetales bacterium]